MTQQSSLFRCYTYPALIIFTNLFVVLLCGTLTTATPYNRYPGSGFGSMSFSSDCTLGQIYVLADADQYGSGEAQSLNFRQRVVDGEWQTPETIVDLSDYYYGDLDTQDAALYYIKRGSVSRWEAYIVDPDTSHLYQYVRSGSGIWTRGQDLGYLMEGWMEDRTLVSSVMGSDSVLYFAILEDWGDVWFVRFDGTTVVTETIRQYNNRTYMVAFSDPHNTAPPRHLSIAVDEQHHAHVVYSVDQITTPVTGGTEEKSKLFYATNASGQWQESVLIDYGLASDDAGLGASVAVAPNGVLAVASTYMPRAYTGSPGDAQLRYLTKNIDGSWSSSVISQTADGYYSFDGQQGTGLYPYLRFDGASQPHILFTDHASEHSNTAWSYSGQMRYATRESATSGTWQLQTIVKQLTGDAFLRRLDNPVLVTASEECTNPVAYFAVSREFYEASFEIEYFEHFDFIVPPIP